MAFLIRLTVSAAALWVVVAIVPGITHDGPWYHLFFVALVFGIVNAFVRPILALLTCPIILLTLGLFLLVLNALMLMLTSSISRSLGIGFHVDGFISAFIGGIVFAIVSAILNLFVKEPEPAEPL